MTEDEWNYNNGNPVAADRPSALGVDIKERALERLRELKSTLTSIGHAVDPLENRFPDEVGVIWLLRLAEENCERRIEDAKEAL